MKVIILDTYRDRFEDLCRQFDVKPETGEPMPVQVQPGVRMMIHTLSIPDSSGLATWIMINYPEWVSNTWQQVQQAFFKPGLAHGHI